jgi:hypothetical protein
LNDRAGSVLDDHQQVRRSLDESFTAQERTHSVRAALDSLTKLQLPDEIVDDFTKEWLAQIQDEVRDPVILHLLALSRLRERGLCLEPGEWMSTSLSMFPLPETLPALRSADQTLDRRPSSLPLEAAAKWRDAIGLLRRSVVTGQVRNWEMQECLAALKAVVILVTLGSDDPLRREFEESSIRFMEGEGAAMLQALQLRLEELDDLVDSKDWVERMRDKLILCLTGRAISRDLRGRSRGNTSISAQEDQRDAEAEKARSTAPGEAIIITEPIPPSVERYDQEVLNQYEVLRRPVPIAPMPPPGKLQKVLAILGGEFPWAGDALNRLEELMLPPSILGAKALALKPLLLVGPPGSGKSRLCRRVAELIAIPYVPIACGGAGDVKVLSGTARGWAGGEPTPILRTMLDKQIASVFVLLDEVDKARDRASTSPPLMNLLLGFLEKETSSRYRDGFLQTTCDLSHVVWWATANSLKSMPAALLSRFDVVYVPGPSREHLPALAESVIREIEREWGLPAHSLPPAPPEIWDGITLSARQMRPVMQKLIYLWIKDALDPKRLH